MNLILEAALAGLAVSVVVAAIIVRDIGSLPPATAGAKAGQVRSVAGIALTFVAGIAAFAGVVALIFSFILEGDRGGPGAFPIWLELLGGLLVAAGSVGVLWSWRWFRAQAARRPTSDLTRLRTAAVLRSALSQQAAIAGLVVLLLSIYLS